MSLQDIVAKGSGVTSFQALNCVTNSEQVPPNFPDTPQLLDNGRSNCDAAIQQFADLVTEQLRAMLRNAGIRYTAALTLVCAAQKPLMSSAMSKKRGGGGGGTGKVERRRPVKKRGRKGTGRVGTQPKDGEGGERGILKDTREVGFIKDRHQKIRNVHVSKSSADVRLKLGSIRCIIGYSALS